MKKLLYILILLAIGNTAWAASTFTVEYTSGKFRITRTGNTAVQETIDWRVVSLSAIEGIHYNGIQGGQAGVYSGTVTFAANETYKEITINELTPSDAYMYQNGGTRKYRFEVLDKDGSILASKDRSMTTGTSVPSSGLFNVKTGTIQSSEFWIDDSGYKQTNSPHTINRSSFYTDAEKNYLVTLGVSLHMTLELQAKEEDDAYEYLQVLIDNTTGCDSENDADKGNPGTPSLSRYMAGFEMHPSSTYDTYKTYTFPVANVADGTKATDPWGYGTDFPLSMQKFKNGCRSTDYKIIVPNSFNTITVRFDASGSKGTDKWWIRNLKAKLTAIDNVVPVVINNYKVSGGRHQKGNTIYVSVAFSEIVTVTGTPTLSSNWGTLSYIAGSGSNVLTFKGTIDPADNNSFSVSSYSLNGGTIKDLAGNSFSGSISHNFGTTLDSEYAWSTSDFNSLNDGSYEIYTTQDLRHLALMVNSGNNNCSGLTFRQSHDITYTHTTEWDDATSQEDNYTAIGTNTIKFQGTFDGQNHTICGIRIYRGEVNLADINQGLFGGISGGTVRAVNLADARITGHSFVAGIAGQIVNATVEDCTVAADVCIHAVHNSSNCHGGIVGYSQGTMQRCLSRARLTVANSTTDHSKYGAIVGYNNTAHAVKDCIVIGATVPDVTYRGAIIGQANEITKVQRNYYRACTVAGVENATGVGVGYDENTTTPHDVTTNQGARALYSITLPDGVTLVRSASATLPGTGNKTYTTGADIDGAPYAYDGATLSLSYTGATPAQGYKIAVYVNGVLATDNGDGTYTATMPAADANVTFSTVPDYAYFWGEGNDGSDDHPYTITTPEGLVLLSTEVNNGNSFYPKRFQLGADIDMSGVANFSPIGEDPDQVNYFRGSFNGQDHTISNLTVSTDGYAGLFGFVNTPIVHVILDHATITNTRDYAGGIAGYSGNIVTYCLVMNSTITNASGNSGAIVGNKDPVATYRNNYYYNCTVDGQRTGIGIGGLDGNEERQDIAAKDGAVQVFAMNPGAGISAATAAVTHQDTGYYSAGTTVTLSGTGSAPAGYQEPFLGYSLNGTPFDGSTFEMPAADAIVTARWTVADFETGHAGTEADPYIIYNKDQLNLLATNVNGGNNYSGKFIKLCADIEYDSTENNFTTIGTSSNNFRGTFDGDGHTVSGIVLTEDSDYQGLFGYLNSQGTVKNVTLSNSAISGYRNVGGIVGYNDGTVVSCIVKNSVTISATSHESNYHGGITGFNYGTIQGCVSSATVENNGKNRCRSYGSIAGSSEKTLENCLVIGS